MGGCGSGSGGEEESAQQASGAIQDTIRSPCPDFLSQPGGEGGGESWGQRFTNAERNAWAN